MRILIITLCIITISTLNARDKNLLRLANLKCENFSNPAGIDNRNPRFSWQIKSDARNVMQSAYRILVSDDEEKLLSDNGNIWDSRKVESDQSILVRYHGAPLEPAKKYYWKVMIWDASGSPSGWSERASWQTGLMNPSGWGEARWICYEEMPASMRLVPGVHLGGHDLGHKGLQRPVIPLFRKEFTADKIIESATLYISGLGHYEAYINGEKIGHSFLSPGWTDYDNTILYNTYDVTGEIREGVNVIGAIAGNGFYNINRERYRKLVIAYGTPKIICRLSIRYEDGSEANIVSGSDWKTLPSPILYTSIYGGEDYDARLEQAGWKSPGYDDSCWKSVIIAGNPGGNLVPESDYPVGVNEIIEAKQIIRLAEDKFLYDFGQNASGIFELKVTGEKGQVIRLLPGELENENHEVNQNATGRWHYYTYTLKGEGTETWRPQFTYYGFRYIQVEGAVPETKQASGSLPVVRDLKMLHTRNTSPRNGTFHCSSDLFNRIYALINWAIQSNLQSVMTDCPHREKLGWLEQTFLMGSSVNYNFEIYHLYNKLIGDMRDAQTGKGLIPGIAPEYVLFEGGFRDSPEWGSASVILPWLVYRWYGDRSVIEKAWPVMVRYVEYLSGKAENQILKHGLGDWYDLGPERPGNAQLTPVALTATAFYYYDLKLLSEMAGLLQKPTEKEHYARRADEVRTAFNNEFFDSKNKVYSTGSQTAMAMPLCMGIVEPQYRERVFSNLVDSVIADDKALTAGDIGFHFLVQALTDGGASRLLYEMNNRDDVPGYGYQLKKGATALTESWQALDVVSNNHLMLGHLMEWFYSGIGGIRQEEQSVGFRNIIIRPAIAGDLSSAKTSFETPYGMIQTDWMLTEGNFRMKVTVPPNTTASVYLPADINSQVYENSMPTEHSEDVRFIECESGNAIYHIGSGSYDFLVFEKK
jgi:alpha-L-rhamnosidase